MRIDKVIRVGRRECTSWVVADHTKALLIIPCREFQVQPRVLHYTVH